MRTTTKVILAVSALALIGFIVGNSSSFECDSEPHSVERGDTLWAIAETKCDGNIGAVVDNLVVVYGDTIHAGDTIWLPTESKCLLENRDGHIYDEC